MGISIGDFEPTREELIRRVAPYDEIGVRMFMEREAAKYQPNLSWKFQQLVSRHAWLFFGIFLALVGVFAFTSGKPFGLGAVVEGILFSSVVFFVPIMITGDLQKGPAEWRITDVELLAFIPILVPNFSVRVQKLYRTTHGRHSLATIVWLIEKMGDGEILRGISMRSKA
ncbi:MAG TPA: hypothetical protein VJH33_03900 [Candidatus Paceibacterota bacterium]